jgi:hypothetical protein
MAKRKSDDVVKNAAEQPVAAEKPAAKKVVAKKAVARKTSAAAPAKKAVAKKAAAKLVQASKPGKVAPPKAVKPAKPVKVDKAEKLDKAEKVKLKLVRDSFTMPQEDWVLIQQLKDRALSFKHPVKKSELLRAGLQVLSALPDEALRAALGKLVALKPGRPKAP